MAMNVVDVQPQPERPDQTQDQTEREPIRGVIRLTSAQLKVQRRVTLVVTLLPFLAVGLAMWRLWGVGISGLDLTLFLSFYLFSGLGITVGYHRLFTHRSFRAVRPVRVVLAFAGSLAVEGSPIDWCATHRRHHAFADQYGDPHSPHLAQAAGIKGVLLGLWHGHMGWLFDDEATDPEEWVPDLAADKDIMAISKAFPWITIGSFVAPPLIALAVTQSFGAAVTAFLWASLVRIFLLHHVTWSINSICHFYGKEAYKARDESKNVWALSSISFGESWHNNHHAFPWSARLGLKFWQVDMGWYAIRTLKFFRLVRDIKVPTTDQMQKRRIVSS
jgi:stearoyl-CoA desaturase (delta-9 desaturase)